MSILEELKLNASEELDDCDMVNNPVHYNQAGIECIDAIEASMSPIEFQGYLKGNSLKYTWRYRYKSKPVEDLKKAQWYTAKLIKSLEDGLHEL